MHLASECTDKLVKDGVDVELIDLRSIKPYDKELLIETVKKTGKLVIVDGSWKTGGFSAELSSFVAEFAYEHLKAPVIRVNLPDVPAPASNVLEADYYITIEKILNAVKQIR
jgi:pyruvate dehydrogenase E1 component beta subunit